MNRGFRADFSQGQSVDNTAVIAQLESQTWLKLSTEIRGDPARF